MLLFALPTTDRPWFYQVCRHIHGVISGSVELQYKIELFAHGMHDNIRDGADTAHCLSNLIAYGNALKELTWTAYETIDVTNLSMPNISDGIIVFHAARRHPRASEMTRLVVFQLPSDEMCNSRKLYSHWTGADRQE